MSKPTYEEARAAIELVIDSCKPNDINRPDPKGWTISQEAVDACAKIINTDPKYSIDNE